jgi:RHS repeat-associated protein
MNTNKIPLNRAVLQEFTARLDSNVVIAQPEDGPELRELLAVHRQIQALPVPEPDPEFVRRLERQFMQQAAASRRASSSTPWLFSFLPVSLAHLLPSLDNTLTAILTQLTAYTAGLFTSFRILQPAILALLVITSMLGTELAGSLMLPDSAIVAQVDAAEPTEMATPNGSPDFQSEQRYAGDPVSLSTGNLVQRFVDWNVPGQGTLDFVLERYYNVDSRPGLFGAGWSSWLDMHLDVTREGSVKLYLADGSSIGFRLVGNEYVASQVGVSYKLLRDTPNFILIMHDQRIYHFQVFGLHALITSIGDRYGNRITIQRTPDGRITSLIDSAGRSYQVSYDGEHIAAITDLLGRTTRYAYDSNNDLIATTNRNSGVSHFAYEDHRLTHLTGPDGILYLQNFYDRQGRVIEQIDASGNRSYFQYNDHETVYVDNLGNRTTTHYDDLFRVTSVTNSLGHTEHYAYDHEHNVVTYTDKRGYEWHYTYDDRGNMLTLTDPLSNYGAVASVRGYAAAQARDGVIAAFNVVSDQMQSSSGDTWPFCRGSCTGSWVSSTISSQNELTFLDNENEYTTSLLTRISDPLNHTTDYRYDVLGRRTVQTDANGLVTRYAYNNSGDLTRIEWPDGSVIQAQYDSNGNQVSLIDANGHLDRYEYDAQGNRVRSINGAGDVVVEVYDAMGRRTSLTDGNGHTVRFSYDNNDNIVGATDAKGRTTTLEYDANGSLVRMIDRRGGVTLYRYNQDLKLVSVTDPEKHTTTYTYDQMYNRTSMTDPLGHVTQYSYNSVYRLVGIHDALGGFTQFIYDENGNLVRMVDALGRSTVMKYDELNRLAGLTDALGGSTVYTHDAIGRVTAKTDPRGALTIYEYDPLGRVTLVRDALGGERRFGYDLAGNVILITDENGHTTTQVFDSVNRLVARTDPGGHTTSWTYDHTGKVLAVIDPLLRKTSYTYDANNNQEAITDALGGVTRMTYDDEDALVAVTDANNHTTLYSHNLDGLVIGLTEAGGQVTRYEYDAGHNLVRWVNARGNAWIRTYDALHRRVSETDPLGHKWQGEYDAVGNLIRATDANGIHTRYDYDQLNRLISVVQNEWPGRPSDAQTNVTTQYERSAIGSLTAIRDARGEVARFEYDLLDRLVREINPLGHEWRYVYDRAGKLVERIDANDAQIRYTYDADGLLTGILYPDGSSVTFGYDAVDNQMTMADSLGVTSNEYDALNRLVATTDHAGQTVLYTFDHVGNRTSITYPDRRTVHYEYDPTNEVVRVSDPDRNVFTVTRDASHNVVRVSNPNSTIADYTFDAAERLIGVRNALADGGVISAFIYTLDPVGDRIHIESTYGWRQPSQLSFEYSYDPLYRLVRSQDNAGYFAAYQYDAVGNRVSMTTNRDSALTQGTGTVTTTYAYNPANELVLARRDLPPLGDAGRSGTQSVVRYDYDANGNRILRAQADSITNNERDWLKSEYAYTYENRLARVQHFLSLEGTNWQPAGEMQMVYDGYDRLVRRQYDQHQDSEAGLVDYIYDGLDPIVESTQPASQHINYYRGLGHTLSMNEVRPGISGSTPYYYHYDGLDNVSALSQQLGQSAHNYRYADFGNIVDASDKVADANSFTDPHNHYTYAGQEWDEHTSVFHFYAREYDPQTGTWLQQDPYRGNLQMPQSLHRYGYIRNNPMNMRDQGFNMLASPDWRIGLASDAVVNGIDQPALHWPSTIPIQQEDVRQSGCQTWLWLKPANFCGVTAIHLENGSYDATPFNVFSSDGSRDHAPGGASCNPILHPGQASYGWSWSFWCSGLSSASLWPTSSTTWPSPLRP